MGQDSDVARVAAAMNAPGFKYRSFGNEPVRIRPGAAGTLAQPPAEPPAFIDDNILPPSMPQLLPLESLPLEPLSPEPLAYEDTSGAMFPYDRFPEALPEPPAMMAEPEPPPLPLPAMPPVMVAPEPPPAPLFSWPESPASPPPPAPMAAPAMQPQFAQAYAPPAQASDPRSMAAGGFRLLESIGHRPNEDGVPRTGGQPGGTLGILRRATEAGDAAGTTMAGMGLGAPHAGPLPPLSPSGHQSGLLPAAAVTVPLSDVMRLIAAGATPPPSPFDAFRAALGAQPGR